MQQDLPRRILVVGRGSLLCRGIGQVLGGGGIAIRALEDPCLEQAPQLLLDYWPDAVLVDAQLADASAFALCREISAAHRHVPVLVLTALDWPRDIALAYRAGAHGLVLKSAPAADYLAALDRVMGSESAFTRDQRKAARAWERDVALPLLELSDRERQVVEKIAAGKNNRDAADELGITQSTVERHVSNALGKVRIASRTELVGFLFKHHVEEWLPNVIRLLWSNNRFPRSHA